MGGKKKGKKSSEVAAKSKEPQAAVEEENDVVDDEERVAGEEEEQDGAEGEAKPKTRGQLIQAHKREQKELKIKTNGMLHSFNKNDKKAKQQTMDAIKKLEDDLKKKQEAELAEFDLNQTKEADVSSPSSISSTSTSTTTATSTISTSANKPKQQQQQQQTTVGKTQKKKAKKAAKNAALLNKIETEKKNAVSHRQIELDQLKKRLQPLNLIIHEISADGNCLYNSVLHQMGDTTQDTCPALRSKVAQFMRTNLNDFLPFFDAENDDDLPREFEEYCDKVANTASWGGQLELKAIAQLTQQHIIIHTAVGPDIEMGEDFKGLSPPLHLTYHKHYYTLGEHYNSAIPKPIGDDDDTEEPRA
eukprot:TRINITY_DN13987_c0_g1_i1.p1 TRINITY_DN13987_c0_g1~~TRINITY_DN13987_c0_g1_i1.p1  ORF type:complete len:360 (-),score=133.59 TRINITY_DN13987_c0_g1_i1:157-1236(-)